MRLMTIRVLYVADCPSAEATFDLVRRIAAGAAVVEKLEVPSQAAAVELRFLGSPTVQVHGVDIEVSARFRTDFAMTCRLYGTSRVPPEEMIAAAIREGTP